MRFRTRAFLICFVPLALLLASTFWIMQHDVEATVHDGLQASLRQNQLAISRIQAHSDLESNRFLQVAGDNPALKAGLELLTSESNTEAARRTVQDQLLELGEHMGFDLLVVAGPDGKPLTGVMRESPTSALVPLAPALLTPLPKGLHILGGQAFQVVSMPLDSAQENLGWLSVGERFDLSAFATSAVLLHNGTVVMSSLPDVSLTDVDRALKGCGGASECTVQLRGSHWISLPFPGVTGGTEYVLRSLEDVDAAMAPVQAPLHRIFLIVALSSVLIVFLCSVVSSQSVVKPIASLVMHMRRTARTGVLTEFDAGSSSASSVIEIRELAESYNRATASVRQAREDLQAAYIEFVGSLASALDARDPYTAGHSRRVSQIACAIAAGLGLPPERVEQVRIGALLHDIGKIGVADHLLQKKERLTDEEFLIVEEHPLIGRRILQGVQGFTPFLPAVELHHENWDGTGYPRQQVGEEIPLEARIIRVADTYDAMTSDRSYRRGMTHERALSILAENSGTEFDPHLVELFAAIPREQLIGTPATVPAPTEVA